jgi:GNAT superfamily N-acetyltransferase
MIEFALDQYPVCHALTNGAQCMVRPLQAEDAAAFKVFNEAVPEKERFLLKHRISGSNLEDWCGDQDYEKRLTLVAFVDGKIVGYAALHQRPGGWKRHIGMVDALILPGFRGLGVLRGLLGDIVEVAQHGGLTRLEAEFNGERKNTILSFGKCGFSELVRLTDYLQDMEAQPHDYVLMGLDLSVAYENAGTGD